MKLTANPPYFPLFNYIQMDDGPNKKRIELESTIRFKRGYIWYEIICKERFLINNKEQFKTDIDFSHLISQIINRFIYKCELNKAFHLIGKIGKEYFLGPSELQISEEERLMKLFENDPTVKM